VDGMPSKPCAGAPAELLYRSLGVSYSIEAARGEVARQAQEITAEEGDEDDEEDYEEDPSAPGLASPT